MPKKPNEILEDMAEHFAIRNSEYGGCYLRHGEIMKAFFPNGITLKTEEDQYQFSLFQVAVGKLNRIAASLEKGEFHKDSYVDTIIYLSFALERDDKNNQKECLE